jgi:hypothetical protein
MKLVADRIVDLHDGFRGKDSDPAWLKPCNFHRLLYTVVRITKLSSPFRLFSTQFRFSSQTS